MTHLAFAWQENDPELHSSTSVLMKNNIIFIICVIFKINFKLVMKNSNTCHGSTDQYNVLKKSFKRFLVNLKCNKFLSRNYESELALILFSILDQNKMV